MLLELFNFHTLIELGVENSVLLKHFITFSADLNHGSDHLGLDEERVEAEG